MILTNCAACAAPLPRKAKQCGRCKTRYCGPACQKQHWDAGGHKDLCKRIKKAGGAEQYNADKKFKEAVAEAVEVCKDDMKGQTCYICMEAVHPRTGEGVVRGCSCEDRDGVASGITGIAHVSCLAEQAKILVAEADENNLDDKVFAERWARWHTCSLCGQDYHGVVYCALSWAQWKTYVGRPEEDWNRRLAHAQLGSGLYAGGRFAEALVVFESYLAYQQRNIQIYDTLGSQENIANCYWKLGRRDEALDIHRRVFNVRLARCKDVQTLELDTIEAAVNLSTTLQLLERHDEAARLLRPLVPGVDRALGRKHEQAIKLCRILGESLTNASDSKDCDEGLSLLKTTLRTARQVLGPTHPNTSTLEEAIKEHVRKTLPAPRFKVGARVECFTGEEPHKRFHKGTVIAHHFFEEGWELDRFSPYQVELDDYSTPRRGPRYVRGRRAADSNSLIHAPEDNDTYIRAAEDSDSSGDEPAAPDGEIRRPGWRGADDDDDVTV